MTRGVYRWLACCALVLTAAQAQCATELKVLATDPAPDALLARQQPFFVRFEVKSAAPVAVSVGGMYKGKAVIDDGGASAPALLPAGGGIGVVSFFYWSETPTRIDEVRLQLSPAEGGAPATEYAFPVALTWLTDDAPPREPAPWVKEWQQAQSAPAAGGDTATAVWLAIAACSMLLAIAVAWFWRRRARAADGATRR